MMVMKRAPRQVRVSEEGEIPRNLARKVTAKRPPMGHVVPKGASSMGKTRGGTSSPTLRPQGKTREVGQNNPSNLRIIGGVARGRRLDSPEVYLRPMMGKVREAVYSTLISFGLYDVVSEGATLSPSRHLDIFSGSGSVGLESLSRGASHCTFVDLSTDCCRCVERNLELCGFVKADESSTRDRASVKCADVFDALLRPQQCGIEGTFDIITLCPPYEEIVYADLLHAVANSSLLRDDTVVLVEYPVELGYLPHVLNREVEGDEGKLIGVRNRRYGRTVIAMYVCNPTGKWEVAQSRPEEFVGF